MRMHTERNPNKDILTWVIHDHLVTGFCSFHPGQTEPAPPALEALGRYPGVTCVEVVPGAISVTKDSDIAWSELARSLNQQIVTLATEGSLRFSDFMSEEQSLRNAVTQIIDSDLGNLANSHGGCISVVGVNEQEVQVSMDGACHNCPATRNTLDRNISGPLREHFPEIKVRVVDGEEPSHASGPTLVRLLGLGSGGKRTHSSQ